MDFRRALAIIEKRKLIIIISVALTTALVYGVTRLMPSRWMASVRLITPSADPLHRVSEVAEPEGSNSAKIYAVLAHGKDVMEASAKAAGIEGPLPKLAENIEFEGSGSHMFDLRYYDSDPTRAITMANALADNLIAQNRAHNSAEALRAVKLLEMQLREADHGLAVLQRQYDQYCLENQIIPGDFLSQLKGVQKEIESAQISKGEAAARIAGNRARLAGLKGTPAPVADDRQSTPSERENRLARQIDDLDAEIAKLRRKYQDSHIEVKSRLDERRQLEAQLNVERSRREQARKPSSTTTDPARPILDLIAADEALIQSEEMTIASRRSELDHLQRVNSKVGNLPSLITEKSENRTGIAVRLNAAKAALDVAERQNPLSVLAYAGETNPPVNTTAGRAMKFVGLAALCALIAVSGLAIALESNDRRLKTVQEADELLPARVVAVIPMARDETPDLEWARIAERRPLSPQSEAYRFLGQHVLSPQNRRFRSLMALSAKSGQGNTRMMANLAITLAQAGQRVILVDANLRHPMLHRVFDLHNEVGLTEVLKQPDAAALEKALQLTPVRNLRVLTSGSAITNPWELFSSHRLEEFSIALKSMADYVLFDTPSALAYTDTLSLSAIVDATLLCVRAVDPLTGAEHRLGEMFALSDVQIMGSVLMDAPPSLIGTYERDLRDSVPLPTAHTPALEAGDSVPNDSPPPVKIAAFAADTPPAADTSPAADPAPAAEAADLSEEESMDPAFEVTETRLTAVPPARPVERAPAAVEPKLFEAQVSAPDPVDLTGPALRAEEVEVKEAARPIVAPEEDVLPAREAIAGTAMAQDDSDREERTMSANDTPPGGFPKTIHGYNVGAVDDYVRKINTRLESLLSQVQSESVRADQSKRLLEQMTSELETVRRRAADAEKREIAALEGQKRSEEEAARLVQDLKEAREKVRGELEGALADARQERDALLGEERQDAEALVAEARKSAAAQVAESQRMVESLQQQVARMSAELQTLRALTRDNGAGYDEMLEAAEAQRVRMDAEMEAERAFARTQIEQVVSDARRTAEEAGAHVAAVYRDHEAHVRALTAECEALVQSFKETVEAQIAQLPALAVRSAVAVDGGRQHAPTIRRSAEPEEKRIRDNREWRTGDWRNAS